MKTLIYFKHGLLVVFGHANTLQTPTFVVRHWLLSHRFYIFHHFFCLQKAMTSTASMSNQFNSAWCAIWVTFSCIIEKLKEKTSEKRRKEVNHVSTQRLVNVEYLFSAVHSHSEWRLMVLLKIPVWLKVTTKWKRKSSFDVVVRSTYTRTTWQELIVTTHNEARLRRKEITWRTNSREIF